MYRDIDTHIDTQTLTHIQSSTIKHSMSCPFVGLIFVHQCMNAAVTYKQTSDIP